MKINDIDFDIKCVDIRNDFAPVNFGFQQINVPTKKNIKIIAQTSNINMFKLTDWIAFDLHSTKTYKVDVNYNGVFIAGIFPVDYSFNTHNIDVTFSADYINGDPSLLKQREVRKEKLKRINQISNEHK